MSLGSADVTVSGRSAGRLEVSSVEADNALWPRLKWRCFAHLVDLQATDLNGEAIRGYELSSCRGEWRLASNGVVASTLTLEPSARPPRSFGYASADPFTLFSDLDPVRLDRIEEHRGGGSLSSSFRLWPRFQHEGRTLTTKVLDINVRVPVEDWLGLLSKLRDEAWELVEIRCGPLRSERLGGAAGALAQALQEIDRGEYATAMVSCRRALERLTIQLKPSSDAIEADPFRHALPEPTGNVVKGIVSRVKELGNKAAHGSGQSYDRAEALFAARVTASVLELVGRRA